jgi:hypothetical protein
MNGSVETEITATCFEEGPQSALEKALLEEYLQSKGYSLLALAGLPEAEARTLMTEACQYASLHLAQVESAVHFRETIRGPS